VPSIVQRNARLSQRNEDLTRLQEEGKDDEPIEVELQDPLNNDCGLCKNSANSLNQNDGAYYFSLIRKCIPLISFDPSSVHKLCGECIDNLNNFSKFIDKVIYSQSIITTEYFPPVHENDNVRQPGNIKVEPLANFEEETNKIPNIQVVNFTQSPHREFSVNALTSQKKCEILEIVDIKPFHIHHFNGTMQQESYDDEDEIQILSPKQMKVELTDQDDELEQIRNYVHISTVCLQDHNYVIKNDDVKMEYEEENAMQNSPLPVKLFKICKVCNKTFKSFKKYLLHKFSVHHRQDRKSKKKNLNEKKEKKIRKICKKIIQQKKEEAIKKKRQPIRKKSYNCPTCGKIFHGPKNLYQHKISHTASSYFCNLCDKKFKRPHGLKQHVKSVHENVKNHVCPLCNHSYLLKADMIKCRHSKLKQTRK
jgi:hypothetical protein